MSCTAQQLSLAPLKLTAWTAGYGQDSHWVHRHGVHWLLCEAHLHCEYTRAAVSGVCQVDRFGAWHLIGSSSAGRPAVCISMFPAAESCALHHELGCLPLMRNYSFCEAWHLVRKGSAWPCCIRFYLSALLRGSPACAAAHQSDHRGWECCQRIRACPEPQTHRASAVSSYELHSGSQK